MIRHGSSTEQKFDAMAATHYFTVQGYHWQRDRAGGSWQPLDRPSLWGTWKVAIEEARRRSNPRFGFRVVVHRPKRTPDMIEFWDLA
jgi:hypothetical protein